MLKRLSLTIFIALSFAALPALGQNERGHQRSGRGGSAGQSNYPTGFQLELSAGKGVSKIQNPDTTYAYYDTLSVEARALVSLFGDENSWSSLALVGGARYLDLTNTVILSNEKETANMVGAGGGVQLRFFKFISGISYDYMLARHYAIGPVAKELNYSMPITKSYVGLQIPFGQLAVSLTYSNSTGSIPAASSGLTRNSEYSDQLYFVNFTYSTGGSLAKFVQLLF